MRVLLINPQMQSITKPEIPSFGLFYVKDALEKGGHKAQLLDIDANRYSKSEVTQFLRDSTCDIIGIGGLAPCYPYLDWLIPEIREIKGNIPIVLGGAIASSLKEKCFKRFDIDFEVIGEGEITVVELLGEIETTRDFDSVRGIGYKDSSNIVFTEKRPLMDSLDNLPFFDDSLFPIESLLKNTKGVFQIHVQRGCPFSCTFCFNNFRVVSSKVVRYRPYKSVVEEMEMFKRKYKDKIRLFALAGECLTLDKEWLINFCREILKRDLKVNYRVTSRVDTIDEERLEWLKRSGCSIISLGLESGDDAILKVIKKGASVTRNRRAVELCKRYIKEIEACIILGYLGETKDTLNNTVRFCKEIGVKPSIFFAAPFPGTELYKAALERGRIKDKEEYLMRLDSTVTFRRSINLTDMEDRDATKRIKASLREIALYYFFKEPWGALNMLRRALVSLREKGLKGTFFKVYENLKRYY